MTSEPKKKTQLPLSAFFGKSTHIKTSTDQVKESVKSISPAIPKRKGNETPTEDMKLIDPSDFFKKPTPSKKIKTNNDLVVVEEIVELVQKSKPLPKKQIIDSDDDFVKIELKNKIIPIEKKPEKKVIVIDSDDDFVIQKNQKQVTPSHSIASSIQTSPDTKSSKAIKKSPLLSIPTDDIKPTKPVTDTTKHTSNDLSDAVVKPEQSQPSTPSKKANYALFLAKKANKTGPKAPGSKEVPEGPDDCLLGLTFILTGEFESISREEATNFVKRHGGKVTSAISKKTSYVVVGEDPGPSKIEKAKTLNTPTLDEDGMFDLVRKASSSASIDAPVSKKQKTTPKKTDPVETATVKIIPKNIPVSVIKSDINQTATPNEQKTPAPFQPMIQNDTLWTEKYKPKTYAEVIGNKSMVEKLAIWLREWDSSRSNGFKKMPNNELSDKRAVLISGPPGIGKTTCAHLVAKIEGWDCVEFNASDTRSKKIIDSTVRELTSSYTINHFFSDTGPKSGKQKHVIIMDEVDGMSAGDRGGVAQLIKLIKNTKMPIICICNDRLSTKVKSLANHCFDMRFRRATADQIESRLKSIAFGEGLELKPNTLANLVQSTQADIRQIINLLSTYRLSSQVLNYDSSKQLAKHSEKDLVSGLWDSVRDLLSPGHKNLSMNERVDLYFQDYSIIPLMIQENYIKTTPSNRTNGAVRKDLNALNRLSLAADSISTGDLVDEVLRRTNNWSLLPIHAMYSTVIPASYIQGSMGGQIMFSSWLGQNSKQLKLKRMLKETHIKMRLNISGDKYGVREFYTPCLSLSLVNPLIQHGKDGVSKTIELMDEYYLNKDDFDTILELGIGTHDQKILMKDIPSSAKSDLTRTYNKGKHPLAFIPSSSEPIKMSKGNQPDLEEVAEEEEFVEEDEEEEKGDDDIEVDKSIKKKEPKGKKVAATKAQPKKKEK